MTNNENNSNEEVVTIGAPIVIGVDNFLLQIGALKTFNEFSSKLDESKFLIILFIYCKVTKINHLVNL